MNTEDVAEEGFLRRHWQRLRERYKSLLPNQQAYVNAALLAVLFLLFLLFRCLDWEVYKAFAALALFYWGSAMVADLQALYKAIGGTLLGRLALVAIFAMGATFSVAGAAQTVNSLVGVDPGKFVHTIAFASVLRSIELIVLALFFALFLGTGFLFFFVLFHYLDVDAQRIIFPWYKPREGARYGGFTALVQAISFIAVCGASYSWWQTGQPAYAEFLHDKTEWFLYSFETYEKAPCVLGKGQRVAFLDGDRVLMATKVGEEITFAVRECKGGT